MPAWQNIPNSFKIEKDHQLILQNAGEYFFILRVVYECLPCLTDAVRTCGVVLFCDELPLAWVVRECAANDSS
jgi:hypothetical protein